MTDEMDHTPDDWLPDSADDATGTGAGDLPSFEEALRAHGFEVEPPKLDDHGVVGPETSDDGELPVDDDSTAPVLADARAGGALGATGGAESSLAALAASWIPRSSVAPPPAKARGSVFRSALVRPPVASAPWVTAPEAQGAPGIEDAAPAEAAVEAPVAPPAGRRDVPDDLEDVHEPNLLDALAAAPDEAPAWTEGEAGVVEMTTMKVTEARDLAEPEDPLAARRRARRRRKDNAAAAKAVAAAATPAAATEPVASGSPTPAADAETADASEAATADATDAETAEASEAETADATDAEEAAATAGRTPVAPSGLSLPPGPPSLLRAKKKNAASQEPGVFERASARTAEPVLGTVQATDATAGSIETHSATAERGDLWNLVSDKMESRAAAAPTAPDRITILLTVLVAFVIVVLVVGFIALFTNFFH